MAAMGVQFLAAAAPVILESKWHEMLFNINLQSSWIAEIFKSEILQIQQGNLPFVLF